MVEFDWTEDSVREILCHLPVKSLIRFKSVSKYWCALFQNPRFAHDHLIITRKRSRPRLLVNKINFSGDDQNIRMRILMFPHHETILPADDHIKYSSSQLVDLTQIFSHTDQAAASSLVPSNTWSFRVCNNGLLCYFDGTSSRVALANMATREFKLLPRLPLPHEGIDDDDDHRTSLLVVPIALAFHHSNFSSSSSSSPDDDHHYTIFFGRRIMKEDLVLVQYATYAASTESWTEITETPLNTSSHHHFTSLRDSAFINGVYYWVWFKYSHGAEIMILTFDVEGRVFREAQGPLTSYPTIANLSLFEHRNGVWLAVSYEVDHRRRPHLHDHLPLFCHDVWVMMDGGDGGWMKQFTVGPLSGMNRMLRLWSNGRADDLAVLASVYEQIHLYDPMNGAMVMDLIDHMEVDGAAGKIIDVFTYEESVVKLG